MVLPAGVAPAWVRLEDGCLICSATEAEEKWSRAPVLPRVPPRSKRGGFADSLARDLVKMVGCVGNAPTMVPKDGCFTGSSRSLRDYQPWGMVAEAGFEPAIRGV